VGKLRRRDVELLEAVNRAVAFDRTVDRARVYSPSLFPPEITCKKYILDDSACEHAFHHRALGELGRIRIEDRSESTHISGLVTGDTENPLHAERDTLFRPLMEKFARADNRRCFQGKHMQCERCGAIAASLIFIDGTERCDFEDCARMMYPEYSRGTAPVWIIGPPARSGPEPERAADILKVWPKREPMRRMRPAQFNPICDRIVAEHCSHEIPQPGHVTKKGSR
jgi:hypothetical protein